MLAVERMQEILHWLRERRVATVEELAEKFDVSGATIRRDLERMERNGLLQRTHGGAVLMEGSGQDAPFLLRQAQSRQAKERIARAALTFVQDGQTVLMDSSSTTLQLAPLLGQRSGLTVVTNGLRAAEMLGECGNIQVLCTGGRLRENAVSLVGGTAMAFLTNIQVDVAFISCRGFTIEAGATEGSIEEAELKRVMLAHARRKVLLCDYSKVGEVFLHKLIDAKELSGLICENVLPEEARAYLEQHGVQVIQA